MKKVELVFIPMPGMGHLPSAVQIANLLVDRNHRLSVTMLIVQISSHTQTAQHESLCASSTTDRIRFITLPEEPLADYNRKDPLYKFVLETQKLNVREAVAKLGESAVAGFVLDMFCATMIDVANEFGIPSYIFFTSSAGYLSFSSHLQEIYDQHNKESEQFRRSEVEMAIPSFSNPIPGKVIPGVYFIKEIGDWLHDNTRKFSETRGILVNTFYELESKVLNWFSEGATSQFPTVYAVGPILNLNKNSSVASGESQNGVDILKWLDEQPPSSVVFLCFGSKGSFKKDQAWEIAHALERSGYRFLWSLRQPPSEGKYELPSDYADIEDVLPEGFLDRTADIGRVIGWAPQVEILAHPATGGFVSHCGWNSTLESVWYGVPMGTWPMYAEQHFNAFKMVVELGLAVEISLDSNKDFYRDDGVIVSAEKIESGIRKLMDEENEVRKLVKAKSEESRKSMMEGGSSFTSLDRFINDVLANSP